MAKRGSYFEKKTNTIIYKLSNYGDNCYLNYSYGVLFIYIHVSNHNDDTGAYTHIIFNCGNSCYAK